jgi:hypothetical protein
MWDFVMDKSGAGAGFIRELWFSPANIHSICFSTIIIFNITRGWHNRPGVAVVPIASQTRIKKKKPPELWHDRWPHFFFNSWGGTLGTAATTGLLYQHRMIGDGDCGEIGGMKIGRGNRSTRRKPAPALLLSITKSHMTRPGFEPGPPRWEASDSSL